MGTATLGCVPAFADTVKTDTVSNISIDVQLIGDYSKIIQYQTSFESLSNKTSLLSINEIYGLIYSETDQQILLEKLNIKSDKSSIRIIDGDAFSTLGLNESKYILNALVSNGISVIVINDNLESIHDYLEANRITSIEIPKSAIAYGIRYNPDTKASSTIVITEMGITSGVSTIVDGVSYWLNYKDESTQKTLSSLVLSEDPVVSDQYVTYYNSHNPYGVISVTIQYSKVNNDHSSTRDWWNIKYTFQTKPGKAQWNNHWHTDDTTLIADYDNSGGTLLTYGPTTTTGTSTAMVAIGVTVNTEGVATVTGNYAWSYTVSNVKVYDYGVMGENLAWWYHDIDKTKAVGSATYTTYPGVTIQTVQGTDLTQNNHFKVHWAHTNTWWWDQYYTDDFYIISLVPWDGVA